MSGELLARGEVRGVPWAPATETVARPKHAKGALLLTIRLEVEVMVDQLADEDAAEGTYPCP